MLHLYYSSDLGALADALSRARESCGFRDPFSVIDIATPGRATAAKLQFLLADRLGVTAGCRLTTIESALRERIEGAGVRCASRARIAQALLTTFSDAEALASPELAPVRAYLNAGAGKDSRLFQLSDELAGLFVEYDRCRPELLAAWSRGEDVPGTHEPRSRWQRHLWAKLETADIVPLLCAARKLGATALGDQELWLFGYSYLPRGLLLALAQLAQVAPVRFFALTPTREYWEDVATVAEAHRAAGRGRSVSTDAPLALRLWGRPCRDTCRVLSEISNYDFRQEFPVRDRKAATTLERFKRDLLELATVPDDAPTRDQSIVIHNCPSLQRELETVAADIWERLERDPTLRCSDIAVYVAGDFDKYQALLTSVFYRFGRLPHHVTSLPVAAESRIVEAFELLVELPLGSFARPELLRTLIHPKIISRFADAHPDTWVSLTDELGIVLGADQSDFEGTYVVDDRYNWDQGIRRLALGSVMVEREGHEHVDVAGKSYRPLYMERERAEQAAKLGLLARSMISDARFAKNKSWLLSDWSRWFDGLVESYLHAESPADERALVRIQQTVRELGELDDGTELSYKLAAATVRRQLASLSVSRGEIGADGILVAPLDLGQVVPANTVYVVGLGADALPSIGRKSALDVRRGTASGDIEPAERTRLAFLEAVLAARSALRLSYVGRDLGSGEARAPSGLIAELEAALGRGYTDALPHIEHTLRPWREAHAQPTRSPSESIRRRAALAGARAKLDSALAHAGLAPRTGDAMRRALEAPALKATRAELLFAHEAGHASAQPATDDEPVVISIATLRKFLESPVQSWARFELGIAPEEEAADLDLRDEPLTSDSLTAHAVLRDVFISGARAGDTAEALVKRLRRRVADEELRGRFPAALFADHITRGWSELITAWHDELSERRGRIDVVGLGTAHARIAVDRRLPPLELDISGRRKVELTGVSEPCMEGLGAVLMTSSKRVSGKHRIRGFIDHVVRSALADEATAGGFVVLRQGKAIQQALRPIARDKAKGYLASLAEELIDRPHDYALPCELIFEKQRNANTDLPTLYARLTAARRPTSDDYGSLRPQRDARIPADADALIAKRFGLLFASEADDD